MDVRNTSCDALLAHRVEQKLKGTRIDMVANKIHVAMPQKRDDVDRAPFIPEGARSRVKYDKEDPMRVRLERDDEQDLAHGAGVYSVDTKSEYKPGRELAHMILTIYQSTTSWPTTRGSTMSFPKSTTARTLPTLSTRISRPSWRHWSERRKRLPSKASTPSPRRRW